MLGFAALAEVALAEVPGLLPTGITAPKVGWFEGWDKRRRIPAEQLNAILIAQGRTPFFIETVEKKLAKSKKLRKTLDSVLEEIAIREEEPRHHWESIASMLAGAMSATRTAVAIKQLNRVLAMLREADDEEVLLLLMDDWNG